MSPVLYISFCLHTSNALTTNNWSPWNTRWFKYDRNWFFFLTVITKHLLAHVSLQRTPLRSQHIFSIVLEASWCPFQKRLVVGGLFTHKSLPVIFEPLCTYKHFDMPSIIYFWTNMQTQKFEFHCWNLNFLKGRI
jgi:hypothetical protein